MSLPFKFVNTEISRHQNSVISIALSNLLNLAPHLGSNFSILPYILNQKNFFLKNTDIDIFLIRK